MHPERWKQIQALFEAALPLAQSERQGYLKQACDGDTKLFDEVLSLLAADQNADTLLEQVTADVVDPSDTGVSINQQIGAYRILERIGCGAMGAVYKALDTRLDRHVALKFLPAHLSLKPDAKTRFITEAKAASGVEHVNICTIYDIGEIPSGQLYIAMAYCDGQNLADRLAQGPLTEQEAIDIAIQVGSGLAKTHARGIYHRDIKPANIIINRDGTVKLVDFGIAKISGVTQTQTGQPLGTVAYMAPEQFRGEQMDQGCDIWALGVILCEMTSGVRPFRGDNSHELMYAVLNVEPILEHVPQALHPIIGRALEKARARRHGHIDDLLRDLANISLGAGSSSMGFTEAAISAPASQPAITLGERRQITVLHGYLDSPAAADPESLIDLLPACRTACSAVVQGLGGMVADSAPGELVAYFGYPNSHEDDARRAGAAALQIKQIIAEYNAPSPEAGLKLRIGIDSGLAVINPAPGVNRPSPSDVIGQTAATAALQGRQAGAGEIIVSPRTHRLINQYFVTEDIEDGLTDMPSSPLYRIISAWPAVMEYPAQRADITPLIGRQQETQLLLDRLAKALQGNGQSVLISGEPGMGKSRLMKLIKTEARARGCWVAECHCSSYHQNSVLHPVVAFFERALGAATDPLATLRTSFEQLSMDVTSSLSVLAPLLSLALPVDHPTPPLPPEQQKQLTLDTLTTLAIKQAEHRPVVLILEDIHWADPTTLDWVGQLLEQLPTSPILLLASLRPDRQSAWPLRSHISHLNLARFEEQEILTMLVDATGRQLPPAICREIVAKSDGVPLFVEELARSVLQNHGDATAPAAQLTIPATLQELLSSRLGRMGEHKQIAQLAAVLGREFNYCLLEALWPGDNGVLRRGLACLVQAELLHQRGVLPQARFIFKHALIQEAAYESLLKSARRDYHQRVAQLLTSQFLDIAEKQPELLAHHWAHAANYQAAAEAYQHAGEKALTLSAYQEAGNHLRRGIDMLAKLPRQPSLDQRELTLQLALVTAERAIRGWTAPEVRDIYDRALTLATQLQDSTRQVSVLFGLWSYHLIRLELATAKQLAEQCTALADSLSDADTRIQAHLSLGNTLFWMGELAGARLHLNKVKTLFQPDPQQAYLQRHGQDPRVITRMLLALLDWLEGNNEGAMAQRDKLLILAEQLDHPFSNAIALQGVAWINQHLGDVAGTRRAADELIALCQAQQFPFYQGVGLMFRGWARAQTGEAGAGIADIQNGYQNYITGGGGQVFHSLYAWLMAEACRNADRHGEALDIIKRGLAVADAQQEQVYQAELHTQLGITLLTVRGDERRDDAEQALQRARTLADKRG